MHVENFMNVLATEFNRTLQSGITIIEYHRFLGKFYAIHFNGGVIENVQFMNCIFDHSAWNNIIFKNCLFKRCSMQYTKFCKCYFMGTYFGLCNLNFSDLTKSAFYGCDIHQNDFSFCDFESTKIEGKASQYLEYNNRVSKSNHIVIDKKS